MNRLFLPPLLLLTLLSLGSLRAAPDMVVQKLENTREDAPALQQEAELYFASGQYELAYLSFDRLSKSLGPGNAQPQLEKAGLYKARCKYQLAREAVNAENKKTLLNAALTLFTNNLKNFPKGKFYPQNLYWKGRSRLDLAAVSTAEERSRNLDEARKLFLAARPLLAGAALKFDNSYYYALTLGEIADAGAEISRRNKNYAAVIIAFEQLISNYPEHPRRAQAEFQLIRYLFKSQRYEEALGICARFQKKFPLAPHLPEVRFYEAESLYYRGRLLEAVKRYDQVIAAPGPRGEAAKNLLINALYGKAWSYVRLANTAGKERRRHYLGAASLALHEVLTGMPHTDPRYRAALYKYAEALVALGDYDQAKQSLQELIRVPQYRVRANYLAGRAALLMAQKTPSLELYREAADYFKRSSRLAEEAANYDILLPSLHNLVTVELSRGRYGEAISFAQAAWHYAEATRNAAAIAQSQLDKARGLIALSQSLGEAAAIDDGGSISPPAFYPLPEYTPEIMAGDAKNTTAAPPENLARKATAVLLAGESRPAAVLAYARDFAVAETAARLGEYPRERLLAEAEEILEILRSQHGVQSRLDEVCYYQGCALFEEAKIKSRAFAESPAMLPLGKKSLAVVSAFAAAHQAFRRAFDANPRGIFAARVHYAQAQVGRTAGLLFQQVAEKLRRQGEQKSAQIYQDRSLRQLEDAKQSLLRALERYRSPTTARQNAQVLLGCVYQDLNRPLEAERVFRDFLANPESLLKLRAFATLRLVDELAGRARFLDAIEVLSSYLSDLGPLTALTPTRDNAIGAILLRLGRYQEAIGDLDSAYRTLLGFARLPTSKAPSEIKKQIEGKYRAYTLGLKLAQSPATTDNAPALLATSIQGLKNLARHYPDSNWAAPALVEIAAYKLGKRDYPGALAIVDAGLEDLQNPAAQLRLRLFRGRVFLARKDYTAAVSEFQNALDLHSPAAGEIELQAKTYLGLGEALLEKSRAVEKPGLRQTLFNQAIEAYAAVWARYPEAHALADQARVAAAGALNAIGRGEEAATIIGGMYDKRRAAALQRSLGGSVGGNN